MSDQLSLRERLEAKERRRITVPILLTDPEPLSQRYEAASVALQAASVNGAASQGEVEALRAEEESARVALAATVARVEFEAMDNSEVELLVSACTIPDDAGGSAIDVDALLPELAAGCAVDESVQDVVWWRGRLASREWTDVEKKNLYYRLFNELHYTLPSDSLGKG